MKGRRWLWLFTILPASILVLAACRPEADQSPHRRADAGLAPSPTPALRGVPVPTPLPSEGHVYLLVNRVEAPHFRRLLRVQAGCLTGQGPCPSPETARGFPPEGVQFTEMHWVPGEDVALILDRYEPRLLQFNPMDGSLVPLVGDAPAMDEHLYWLPDGRAVFVVQAGDDYDTRLVALRTHSGEATLETLAFFQGKATALGILDDGHVLVSVEIYGLPSERGSLKPEVVEVRLLAVDPRTGSVRRLREDVDWMIYRPYPLLLRGRWLTVTRSGTLGLWDLHSGTKWRMLGEDVGFPAVSPGGRRLAFFIRDPGGGADNILRLVDVETGQTRDLARLPAAPRIHWSPDGTFLVLASHDEESFLSLGSITILQVETALLTSSALELGEYGLVESVSWGP